MCTNQVADVDVIANAGIIRRRMIDTVDLELGPKPERRLDAAHRGLRLGHGTSDLCQRDAAYRRDASG
jgi:hypothetical protein